jgi:SHS2 domain-containing protein
LHTTPTWPIVFFIAKRLFDKRGYFMPRAMSDAIKDFRLSFGFAEDCIRLFAIVCVSMKKYEMIEHTADIGVRVFGKTEQDLFKNAAAALFGLVARPIKQKPVEIKKIQLECASLEELFIRWLNELISIFFAYKFFPSEYNITLKEERAGYALRASLRGISFESMRNVLAMEIKAATYHGLRIQSDTKGFTAEVIFDV